MTRKSWADRSGIKSGVWGEVIDGIPIRESNRATVWEFRKEGIESLQKIAREQYTKKGVRCILFGVRETSNGNAKYAIFVQSGFLKDVTEDE